MTIKLHINGRQKATLTQWGVVVPRDRASNKIDILDRYQCAINVTIKDIEEDNDDQCSSTV